MAKLQLKNLRKMYGQDVLAVDDFNLDIDDKEFVVLVGPSGCGKSTTLRMVAGLEDITSGDLFIGGDRMNDVAPKDRDIAMVFQSYALYPHMSVFDNMAFALKLQKAPKEEIKQKVEEAARILDITELLKRKPRALSGGQRQRVAIGRAIVRNPKVFLMDEPLSNLDAKLRNQMRAEIIRLRKRINTTFIYVTHDQVEAMTLGDRIVIMNKGRIQQIGTPTQVFCTPANLFVAGFIGVPQMNFFSGKLTVRDGVYYVSLHGIDIKLNADMQTRLKQAARAECDVTVGIRPEHIVPADETNGSEGTIDATLSVSEMMGSEMYLHVDMADEQSDGQRKEVIIRVPIAMTPSEYAGAMQNEVRLRFTLPPDLLHLFDVETQENIVYPYA